MAASIKCDQRPFKGGVWGAAPPSQNFQWSVIFDGPGSHFLFLPVQAATGGRSGVSVYKAGRSVPLDSAQLDLSRLALPQLGSAGVEKCFEIHVPSSGLKTQKNRKTSKNAIHEYDPSAGCQNEGPKNELDECTVRFVAAQLPPRSIVTSVDCGPNSPRPKDHPGLGDANTLKP